MKSKDQILEAYWDSLKEPRATAAEDGVNAINVIAATMPHLLEILLDIRDVLEKKDEQN